MLLKKQMNLIEQHENLIKFLKQIKKN